MELNEWATRILSADTIEEKLFEPDVFSDDAPGSPYFWDQPTRPPGMDFQKHTRKNKLPKFHEFSDPDKRAICMHRFAGHELLAVEIMAYALLAFPDAPKHFRRGVANTLREEQGHVRLYMQQMERLGIAFEDLPLYKNFWAYTPYLQKPEEYLSVMSLTFEMANLDFAPAYGKAFMEHGDAFCAKLMQQILKDEIAHVAFGWSWLKKMKNPSESEWSAWQKALPANLSPNRAMGTHFQEDHRKSAGISDDWIIKFKNFVFQQE
ncbi:MAG: hypothetical protein K940chlam6_00090 [Chlamydiae bacterium]|nr:hypothetical protein [Chlamydiota bacterium]